ncbi:MAG: hypothetical protein ACOX2F_05965 [bacterium]
MPSLKHLNIVLISLTFLLAGCFEKRDPFLICDNSDCSYSLVLPGIILIQTDNYQNREYFFLTPQGLKKTKLKIKEGTLFAYDFKRDIGAVKKTETDNFVISTVNAKGAEIEEISLPTEVASINSGCFLKNGSLAMLLLKEHYGHMIREYIISISDEENINNWESFVIDEQDISEFANFAELDSPLGSAIEKPFSIQCSNNRIFVHTLSVFSDMAKANIYEFDVKKKSLTFLTDYHPLNEKKDEISVFFNERSNTGYFHQNRRIFAVKGTSYPIKTSFEQPGKILFSPLSSDGKLLVFFVPDIDSPFRAKARVMGFN